VFLISTFRRGFVLSGRPRPRAPEVQSGARAGRAGV